MLRKFMLCNFRLPLFVILITAAVFGYKKLYNAPFINHVNADENLSILFFVISMILFIIITLRAISDISGLIFGQKGEGALTEKSRNK